MDLHAFVLWVKWLINICICWYDCLLEHGIDLPYFLAYNTYLSPQKIAPQNWEGGEVY